MTENRMGSKHPLELAQEILLARLKHCPVSDAKLEAVCSFGLRTERKMISNASILTEIPCSWAG